jgi:hypothetical protein
MLVIISKKIFDSKMQNLRKRIYASGLSRILKKSINGPFAILSAWRGNVRVNPKLLDDNKKDDIALRQLVRELGYGFVRLYGLYTYVGEKNISKVANEESLFIPGISQDEARSLAQACFQESYIWGDNGQWAMLNSETNNVEWGAQGNVVDDFRFIGASEDPEFASAEEGPIEIDQEGKVIRSKPRRWGIFEKSPKETRLWQLDSRRTKQKEEGQKSRVASLNRKYFFYSYGMDHCPPPVNFPLSGISYEGERGPGEPNPESCEALVYLRSM